MKLASLNGSLLARKGEAKPSTESFTPQSHISRLFDLAHKVPTHKRRSKPPAPATKPTASRHFAKTVRLTRREDISIRLIAARNGVCQQDILAAAVVNFIEAETGGEDCICKITEDKA